MRIWGFTDGNPLNRKFTLKIEGKDIAAELFRRTNKALTVTGNTLDPAIREFSNIDRVFDWAVVWGERRKAAAAAEQASREGNGFDSTGCKYSIDDMAKACIDKGYEYLVISDHSKTASYANGLSEERIRAQHLNIDELNDKLKPFKIFIL